MAFMKFWFAISQENPVTGDFTFYRRLDYAGLQRLCYTGTSFLQGGLYGRNNTADSGESYSPGPALSLFHSPRFRAGAGPEPGPLFRAHHAWRHAGSHSRRLADFAGSGFSAPGVQRAHVRAQGAGSRDPPGRAVAAHAALAGAFAFPHSRVDHRAAVRPALRLRRRAFETRRARFEREDVTG